MSDFVEWDFDSPAHRQQRRRSRPQVEIIESTDDEPRSRAHVRHHRQPSWTVPAVVIITVPLLWRLKLGVLMLAALAGWRMIATFLIVVAILSVIAWREHRVGRPF
jgi:hypothetical protein